MLEMEYLKQAIKELVKDCEDIELLYLILALLNAD